MVSDILSFQPRHSREGGPTQLPVHELCLSLFKETPPQKGLLVLQDMRRKFNLESDPIAQAQDSASGGNAAHPVPRQRSTSLLDIFKRPKKKVLSKDMVDASEA